MCTRAQVLAGAGVEEEEALKTRVEISLHAYDTVFAA